MQERVIKFYLKFLPYYLIIGIILSIVRTAFQTDLNQYFLLTGLIFDLVIIFSAPRRLPKNSIIKFVGIFLFFSFFIGIINLDSPFNRRIITDVTNPLFFFLKIFIFSRYWNDISFKNYLKYFVKITVIYSLILLPITYYFFNAQDVNRLSIFPPLELGFAFYLHGSNIFLPIIFFIIVLYGKRSLLISVALVFVFSFFKNSKKNLYKFLLSITLLLLVFTYFDNISENKGFSRISNTFDQVNKLDLEDVFEVIGGSRYLEFKTITQELDIIDYVIGKGVGYTYGFIWNNEYKTVANSHFSPIGLISKYGIIFTVFLYYFLLRLIYRSYPSNKEYKIAVSTALVVFIESFFAYSLFVIPIFPIVLGYLIKFRK